MSSGNGNDEKPLRFQFKWTLVQTLLGLTGAEFFGAALFAPRFVDEVQALIAVQTAATMLGIGANWGISHSAIKRQVEEPAP